MIPDRPPERPEVGVLGLVPDTWQPPWMPRHHVLARLARHYHVAWLEPPQEWRAIWLEGELRDRDGPPELARAPGFHRVVPGRWLPKLYRPEALAAALDRFRVRRAARVLRAQGCRRIVPYVWRPGFAHALDAVDHDASMYHVDDDYSFSEDHVPLGAREKRLLTEADAVFLHSPALWERLSRFNPRSVYLPNGVDFDAFASPAPEPPDLAPVPRPRVGYVGIVKKQLDLGLLEEIARRRPDWSVVMVGPTGHVRGEEERLGRLRDLSNVHFLGGKPPGEVPAYVQHMDVCTLPYSVDGYTRYINPMKTHEYLAAGRPVVGVPIPAVEACSDVVALAATPAEWVEALEAAMRPGATSDDAVERRRAEARRHDWGALTRKVAETVAEVLARRRRAGSP